MRHRIPAGYQKPSSRWVKVCRDCRLSPFRAIFAPAAACDRQQGRGFSAAAAGLRGRRQRHRRARCTKEVVAAPSTSQGKASSRCWPDPSSECHYAGDAGKRQPLPHQEHPGVEATRARPNHWRSARAGRWRNLRTGRSRARDSMSVRELDLPYGPRSFSRRALLLLPTLKIELFSIPTARRSLHPSRGGRRCGSRQGGEEAEIACRKKIIIIDLADRPGLYASAMHCNFNWSFW